MSKKENEGEDLYAELAKTLKDGDNESGDEGDSPAASDQEPEKKEGEEEEKKPEPQEKKEGEDENAELSEEEISKLHPKAQKRIRDLAAKVKELAEKPADEKPQDETPEEKDENAPEFNNVDEFLNAVEDEPSRKLLQKFYSVIKGEISTTLSPIERANNEAKFEQEFAKYEKIEGLADYKSDLKKTFIRNPGQSLKALVGEVITDISLNKIKPIENKPSDISRGGKVNTENMSKDELYDLLDSTRE